MRLRITVNEGPLARYLVSVSRLSIRPFYEDWPVYHRQIVDLVRGMPDDQLAVRPAPDRWLIWATVGHMAGVRIFWLCYEIGEPGIEATPWADPAQTGWEEDLDHPRGAEELAQALTRRVPRGRGLSGTRHRGPSPDRPVASRGPRARVRLSSRPQYEETWPSSRLVTADPGLLRPELSPAPHRGRQASRPADRR